MLSDSAGTLGCVFHDLTYAVGRIMNELMIKKTITKQRVLTQNHPAPTQLPALLHAEHRLVAVHNSLKS